MATEPYLVILAASQGLKLGTVRQKVHVTGWGLESPTDFHINHKKYIHRINFRNR